MWQKAISTKVKQWSRQQYPLRHVWVLEEDRQASFCTKFLVVQIGMFSLSFALKKLKDFLILHSILNFSQFERLFLSTCKHLGVSPFLNAGFPLFPSSLGSLSAFLLLLYPRSPENLGISRCWILIFYPSSLPQFLC